jgi:GTPase SAR1 family protein
MNLIGRERELAVVREHLRAGKNLVVFGPAGVGKTALVQEAIRDLPGVLYGADSATLKTACESLLAALGRAAPGADNIVRKRAVLHATAGQRWWFVFDHVGRVSPKLESFLENVCEAHPVIVVTRSIAWSDMGHLKMLLWDFDRLELAPLPRASMLKVLRAQMQELQLRVPDHEHFEADVLRIAGHNLHVLMELCRRAANGQYVFGEHLSTRLVDIDRRIAMLEER